VQSTKHKDMEAGVEAALLSTHRASGEVLKEARALSQLATNTVEDLAAVKVCCACVHALLVHMPPDACLGA
jgi:hypothetical protein